jgi:hypothetical protein
MPRRSLLASQFKEISSKSPDRFSITPSVSPRRRLRIYNRPDTLEAA